MQSKAAGWQNPYVLEYGPIRDPWLGTVPGRHLQAGDGRHYSGDGRGRTGAAGGRQARACRKLVFRLRETENPRSRTAPKTGVYDRARCSPVAGKAGRQGQYAPKKAENSRTAEGEGEARLCVLAAGSRRR